MAITKDPAVQDVSAKTVLVNFSDIASGVAASAIDIPPGAIILSGNVITTTAFNSATSDVVSVGDAASAARYLSASSIHAAGVAALVPTGFSHPGGSIQVTWTGVGAAPTAGQFRLNVTYIQPGKAGTTYETTHG